MMKEITEKLHITKVHVEDAESLIPKLGGDVQVVSAPCWEAVAFAALMALRSFKRGTNTQELGGENCSSDSRERFR